MTNKTWLYYIFFFIYQIYIYNIFYFTYYILHIFLRKNSKYYLFLIQNIHISIGSYEFRFLYLMRKLIVQ